jgi:hypothetical protein
MSKVSFLSDIRVGGGGLDVMAIRAMAKENPVLFVERVQKLVASGKLKLQDFRRLAPMFAALQDVKVPVRMDMAGIGTRTIDAAAFPILTGTLVIAAINEAYQAVPTIGQELVTEMDDNKKVTTIAAIHEADNAVEEVKELQDFPEVGANEEKVEIRHKRNGRLLTISMEAIEENEIANIVQRVNKLGEICSDWIEEQTLKRVTDYDGSAAAPAEPYVYRPNGTGTALFSATANTPGTRAPSGTCVQNNAFVDESDLENARVRLATMKNSRGKRMTVPQSEIKILCPDAIVGKVLKVANSELVPGVANEVSNWGPRGKWRINPDRIVTSPKLDDLSSSAWYYGAPQRQFMRKWKLRMEYVTLGADTESYLKRRIAFQARIAWDVEIGATDYVYWIQNLSAATFPKDA